MNAGTLGILIGIAGLILAAIGIILTARSRTKGRLVYQTRNTRLVGQPDTSRYDGVKILFNDVPVPGVMVCQMAMWNAGNTTIRCSDLVKNDPLTVSFPERTRVLRATRLTSSRRVNEFQIDVNPDSPFECSLQFDYLDRGDGALFEIMYTGSFGDPTVKGSIRGIAKGCENWGTLTAWEGGGHPLYKEVRRNPRALVSAIIFMGIFVLLPFLSDQLANSHPEAAWILHRFSNILLFLVPAIAVSVVVILSALGAARQVPKSVTHGEKK